MGLHSPRRRLHLERMRELDRRANELYEREERLRAEEEAAHQAGLMPSPQDATPPTWAPSGWSMAGAYPQPHASYAPPYQYAPPPPQHPYAPPPPLQQQWSSFSPQALPVAAPPPAPLRRAMSTPHQQQPRLSAPPQWSSFSTRGDPALGPGSPEGLTEAPKPLRGVLYKKSPSTFAPYQERSVVVKEGMLAYISGRGEVH